MPEGCCCLDGRVRSSQCCQVHSMREYACKVFCLLFLIIWCSKFCWCISVPGAGYQNMRKSHTPLVQQHCDVAQQACSSPSFSCTLCSPCCQQGPPVIMLAGHKRDDTLWLLTNRKPLGGRNPKSSGNRP